MKKIISPILISLLFFLQFTANSYAFFTQNHKKKMLYGAFKQSYTADIYLGVRAGFLIKTFTPNITTMMLQNVDALNKYQTAIPNQVASKTSGNYTYSVGVDIGLRTKNSKLRHELNFEWYGISSDKIGLDGTGSYLTYSYASISGHNVSSMGVYANIYRLMYSVFFNFENSFDLFKVKWDVFVGLGAGIAIISGGTYIGEEITTTSTSGTDTTAAPTGSYVSYDVSSATDATKYRLDKSKSFAVAYQIKIGAIANISQSFAASVALGFGATSRPLFTTKFKAIDKVDGAKSHLEYHVALEIGLLLKAFEIAL